MLVTVHAKDLGKVSVTRSVCFLAGFVTRGHQFALTNCLNTEVLVPTLYVGSGHLESNARQLDQMNIIEDSYLRRQSTVEETVPWLVAQ